MRRKASNAPIRATGRLKSGDVLAIPFDEVARPKHYNSHPSGIEAIEITRHENFNVGNALKYLLRHRYKGNPITDLKKAQWYLADEIKRLEKESEGKGA